MKNLVRSIANYGLVLLVASVIVLGGCAAPVTSPTPSPTVVPTGNNGNLQVTVRDANAGTLSGAKIVSSTQPAGQTKVTGLTASDGTVTFQNIAAGGYKFTVSRADYSPQEVSVNLQIGQTTGIAVYLVRTSPATSPSPAVYSQYDLEYILFTRFTDLFWTDPDFYPIGRPGIEELNSQQQFPAIQANTAEFNAILKQLNLQAKPDYSADEKLAVYREHKKLTFGAQMTATGSGYDFTVRTGEVQGYKFTGTISLAGVISNLKQETSFNTHPICLSQGTLIDTPEGQVAVQDLVTGMTVWTVDAAGTRIAAAIVATSRTPVPAVFQMVKLTLSDGRIITASPSHPSASGQALGNYRVGNVLNGAEVARAELVTYSQGYTYDILPAGGTGLYWANGILLGSTLAK